MGCVSSSSLMNATSIPSREEPVSTRNVALTFPIRSETVMPLSMQRVRGMLGSSDKDCVSESFSKAFEL